MNDSTLPNISPASTVSSSSDASVLVRNGEADLRELLRILWRRKPIILGSAILGSLLAILMTYQLAPIYSATTTVMIDPRRTNVVNLDSVMSGLATDSSAVLSEIEILKSNALTEKVVKKLGLVLDPEFNRNLGKPSLLSRIGLDFFSSEDAAPAAVTAPASIETSDATFIARPTAVDLELSRVTRVVRRKLDVTPEGRSYVIRLDFESSDPAKAAYIANTYAELYTLNQLDAKLEAVERANTWLNERTSELRDKVAASERAVEEYRSKSGLIGVRGESLLNQQLAELNSQLIVAGADRARAEARLKQVRVDGPNGGTQTASEVLASPTIQKLREQETELRRREAELLDRYGEKHPRMINTRAELRDVENRINQEIGRVSSSLQGELLSAQARENTLKASLSRLQSDAAVANQASVRLREYEREATANRTLLETFMSRFSQTTEQGGIQQSDSRVVSRAMVPTLPVFPRLIVNLPVGFAIFLVLGIILAFLAEKLDSGFRSSEQIETLLGLSTMALIPGLSSLKDTPPQQYLLDKPGSQFSEAFRSLRTGLLLTNLDVPPKVVMLTSTVPDEGKSSDALCLARSTARSGQKAILIDCDLRVSSVHKMLNLTPKVGLTEVVLGQAKLEDALIRDEASGLYVLPNATRPDNPPDILSSVNMAKLVQGLAASFDLVVLDTPPVLAVSDALILSRLVDRVIFVIRWEKTPRTAVVSAMKQLRQVGANVAGVVLSRVNMRKHSLYGYGDSWYSYRGYKKYYYN